MLAILKALNQLLMTPSMNNSERSKAWRERNKDSLKARRHVVLARRKNRDKYRGKYEANFLESASYIRNKIIRQAKLPKDAQLRPELIEVKRLQLELCRLVKGKKNGTI